MPTWNTVASMVLPFGLLLGAGGCGGKFYKSTTPSGVPCSDMPVYPAGQAIDQQYHRLRPIASSPKASTEAERLESLRRKACQLHADAIIEAANEETRTKDGAGYVTRASGTAVAWVKERAPATPLQSIPSQSAPPSAAPPAGSPPAGQAAPPPADQAASAYDSVPQGQEAAAPAPAKGGGKKGKSKQAPASK
ncbi:MAG TPA: hypothetical protein VH877_29215 [Polyangia bacterium]|jgi:hypothetical protein|nr:hypothetical protein [Polyangia bacterium]